MGEGAFQEAREAAADLLRFSLRSYLALLPPGSIGPKQCTESVPMQGPEKDASSCWEEWQKVCSILNLL